MMSNEKNSCMKRWRNQKGLTLVELMVSMAVFLVLISMVMVVVAIATTTVHSSAARITSQQDLRKALTVMVHELSEVDKDKIYIPGADPSQIVFQIPIRVNDGSEYQGEFVDDKGRQIFGARTIPTTNPDGTPDFSVQYILVPNNDVSNSNSLVRRVLDSFPAGNQVGNDFVVANYIDTLNYTTNGKTLSINVATVKHNKHGRNMRITGNFGVTMRN